MKKLRHISQYRTLSLFMHPGDVYHGVLDMVAKDDVFIGPLNAGETDEVVKLIPFFKVNGNVSLARTGNLQSTLLRAGSFNLDAGLAKEACVMQLAPISSITATFANVWRFGGCTYDGT